MQIRHNNQMIESSMLSTITVTPHPEDDRQGQYLIEIVPSQGEPSIRLSEGFKSEKLAEAALQRALDAINAAARKGDLTIAWEKAATPGTVRRIR